MKRIVLVGHGIERSLSPLLHAPVFDRLGLDARYEALDVPPEAFDRRMRELLADPGVAGFNVTAPYKERVLPLLDELDVAAQSTGAVNCGSRLLDSPGLWLGSNTDSLGFLDDIRGLIDPAGRPAGVIGAGGAAAACTRALLSAGASEVRILGRTPERARSLARRFADPRARSVEAASALAGSALLVHATPARPPAIPDEALEGCSLVYDLNYRDLDRPFIDRLAALGVDWADGTGMLLRQAALAYPLWFRVRPPVDELYEVYYNYARGDDPLAATIPE